MEIRKLQGAIEAILFASGEPVPESRLCEALSLDRDTVRKLMQLLMEADLIVNCYECPPDPARRQENEAVFQTDQGKTLLALCLQSFNI